MILHFFEPILDENIKFIHKLGQIFFQRVLGPTIFLKNRQKFSDSFSIHQIQKKIFLTSKLVQNHYNHPNLAKFFLQTSKGAIFY